MVVRANERTKNMERFMKQPGSQAPRDALAKQTNKHNDTIDILQKRNEKTKKKKRIFQSLTDTRWTPLQDRRCTDLRQSDTERKRIHISTQRNFCNIIDHVVSWFGRERVDETTQTQENCVMNFRVQKKNPKIKCRWLTVSVVQWFLSSQSAFDKHLQELDCIVIVVPFND
jgi:hypothetical protein